MNNVKLLSFKGVTLTTSDVDILTGRFFLNDQIIEFYFKFLEHTYKEGDILLVSPSISFWLANSTDNESVIQTSEWLKLSEKKLIFFTINNDEDQQRSTKSGGTHWSLLVYYREDNSFYHHDSYKSLNKSHAKRLFQAIKGFVDIPSDTPQESSLQTPAKHNDDDFEARFVELTLQTPQQLNSYDCGLYVMKITAVICQWYRSWKEQKTSCLWLHTLKDHVKQSYVEFQMRTEILELVFSLKDGLHDNDD